MWIGIFVAVLFVVGQASEVDRCRLDGENACRDYSTAERCNTSNYCKAEIWNQPINKNTDMCQTCLLDITNLQNFNIAKTTRAIVKSDLLALCKSLQFDEARTECTKMVNENFDKVHREIDEQLDPNVICRALHICLSQEIKEAVMKLAKEPKAIESIGSVCALDSRNGCYDYSSAKKCGILPTCKAMVWSGLAIDDDICEMCKQEVMKLENWIKQGSTKAAIEKDLMNFCNRIPVSAVRDECKTLIAEGFDMIYDDLIAFLDPSTLCTAMRLCTRVSVENYVKGMMDKLPSMLQRAQNDGKLPVALVKLTKTEMPATSCADCEAFMGDFQNTALNNKKVVNDWLNMLKTECQTLGEGLGTLCEENVEMFVYSVMTRHRNNSDDPKAACQSLMMCNAFTKKQRVGDMCTDCKTFFTDWQEELKNNPEVIDQIVHAVSEFYCLQKPEHFREQCTRYVSMVIKVLIERMERENVGTICKRLEFCSPPSIHHDVKMLARKVSKQILQSMPEQKPKVTGEPCADCKNFITDLQGVIQNNQSLVQELVDLVKQECEQLGPELSGVCRVYVDENYETILHQFASYDADTICTTIMMCSEVTVKLGGDLCTDCVAFFGDWQTIITNNQSIINAAMTKLKEAICSDVPTILRDECDKLFDEDSKEIINDIIANDPENVCSTLYFCDDYEKTILIEEPKQVEGEPCPDCKNFITDLQGVIKNNQSLVQELVVLVKLQCDQLGIVLSGVCRTYVEDNYRIVLEQFAAYDVGTICTTIDMCSQSTQIKRLGGDLCTDCVAFFGDWQTTIANNQSIITDVTKKAKDAICSAVPEILKSECENLFDEDCGKIINAIKNNAPGDVCGAMYFCDAKSPVTIKAALIQSAEHPVAANEFECQACQFVIEEVEKMIEENRTEEAITDALKHVCELYGEDIRDDCEMFIQQYGADIIDFLLQEMNSLEICTKLGLCEKAQKFHLVKKAKEQNLGVEIECEFCIALFAEVDRILEDKATEKEILDSIAAVCSYLGKEEDECNTIVHEYGPKIIQLIAQELKPNEICAVIKACVKAEVKTVKVDASTECTVCQLVATELDNLLKENSTEAEIEKALEEVCSILPSTYKTTCDSLVEEYGPTIVALLANEFAPDVICVQLKLCSEVTKKVKDISSDTDCEVCKLVAMELDKAISSSSTEAEIEKALESVCKILPSSIKDTCDSLVTEYGPEIVQLLVKELAPDVICKELKLCTEISQKVKDVSSDTECEVCKIVAMELENVISSSSTEAEIEEALETVCNILPSDVRDACDSLVTEYGPEIIKMIVQELAPDVICKQLKLCTETPQKIEMATSQLDCEVCTLIARELDNMLNEKSTQAEIEAALEEICTILPNDFKSTCASLIKQYGQMIVDALVEEFNPSKICAQIKLCPQSTMNVVDAVTDCQVCQWIAQGLDDLLKQKATQAEIEAALKEVCTILPSSVRDTCSALITDNWDTIVAVLVAEMQPNHICVDIKVCPTVSSVNKVKSQVTCELCELVMGELDTFLEKNSTQEEIKKFLEKICSVIPGSAKNECMTLITQYGGTIIDILLEVELSPAKVCPELGICPASDAVGKVKGVAECDICQVIVKELDVVLDDKSTESDILNAVNKICDLVPKQSQALCHMYINDYGPGVIDILVHEIVPSKVCATLHACVKKSVKHRPMKLHVGDEKCSVCKEIITMIDRIIKDNVTIDALDKALEQVCNQLPESLRSECVEMVDEIGPMLEKYIDNIGDPAFVCEHLKLCPTDVSRPKILGVDPCTYGPSYWCKDLDTARTCNAVTHCMNHVW